MEKLRIIIIISGEKYLVQKRVATMPATGYPVLGPIQ